ncbi:hypothetical protein AX15_002129 [Amanita polypyramis BW_CC]|nr:hypothetical protein AX15_002129 [Amanita polypyramis BW_CC]
MSNTHKDDPKRIGFWKIGRTIGTGSSGRVRISRHSRTGQYAAIKIVSKTSLSSEVSLNHLADEMEHKRLAIEREIVVMKLIDHPNIMRLYDVWETSTELFLVLEYVQGGELFEYLCEKGRLTTPEALGYFQQIISAVDYCHRFNIAHRDLKPENILLDQDHNIKIADFGMAAWQANKQDGLLHTSCGSPHYAAPEIINGEPYDGSAADIWSCGIILYALLSGKLPFDDEDCSALLGKVMVGRYVMPQAIDPLAQDLIRKMLAKDARKRITMDEIQKHPFYLLQKPKLYGYVMPNLDDIARPINSSSSIDPDIFANLRTLWHGTSDRDIIKSLLNEERNWQKGIYHLLVDYRNKDLDGCFGVDRDASTRARYRRTRSKPNETLVDTKKDRVHPNIAVASSSRVNSPSNPELTGMAIVSNETLDHKNSKAQTPCARSAIPNVDSKCENANTLKGDYTTQPRYAQNKGQIQFLAMTGGDKENDKENITEPHTTDILIVGKSKRVRIVDPGERRLNKLKKLGRNSETKTTSMRSSPERSENTEPSGMISPIQPASPRRSWLTNVFKFKSTSHWLLSTQNVYVTRNECRRLVMGMGAQVMLQDPEGLGILKCRFGEKAHGIAQTMKFRVEMHLPSIQEDPGYQVSLLFLREKGSLEVFKTVFERLRDKWELDNLKDGASSHYMIPATSFGGGFGELVY